jgi:magnesium-transporting ATPase (P-type)
MAASDVLAGLKTTSSGLTNEEAGHRLAIYGPNVLPHGPTVTVPELLWRQVKSPLALVMAATGTLALSVGKATDGIIVLAVVVLNAVIGAFQEHRAVHAIAALDALVPEYARALRDEITAMVSAAQLVLGDIVLLEAGDRVPADLRLVQARSLLVNEASLTGEAALAGKQPQPVALEAPLAERASMLFSGTLVAAGTAMAVVVATGAETELGRISALASSATEPETPLTLALKRMGKQITVVVSIVAFLLFVVARARGFTIIDAIRSAVALAAAAVPAELPATITIALAFAVRRMARRNAIVRSLPSVETLGSTTVICTDKTGTLTRGEMTARHLWAPSGIYELTGGGYAPTGELRANGVRLERAPVDVHSLHVAAVVCNDASLHQEPDGSWVGVGDTTEVALVVAAEKVGLSVREVRASWPRVDAIPFDPALKYMATLHQVSSGEQVIILKGAPEVVLQWCDRVGEGIPLDLDQLGTLINDAATKGLRMIAIASRRPSEPITELREQHIGNSTLLGLLGLSDPPRPEAAVAVAKCHQAGIRVKMVTGDHPTTARAIAAEIGIVSPASGPAVTGREIESMGPHDLQVAAAKSDVFARVAPEHKLKLVRALQARGEVVAMTGDGVNDAPALKQADVGVAMGLTGTAAARQAADLVLVDDNFANIAAAVEEGRRCYDNLVKALTFLLPTNLGQSLVVLAGVLMFPVVDGVPLLPLIPIQALWVNFVTGLTLALPLAFESPEPGLMKRPPRRRTEPLFTQQLVFRTLLVGVVVVFGAVALFLYEYYGEIVRPYASPELALRKAQTMVVTTVVLYQEFYLVQCRSLRSSVFHLETMGNPIVYSGMLATLAMQMAFVQAPIMNRLFNSAPLSLFDWLLAAVVAATVLPIVATEKSMTSH